MGVVIGPCFGGDKLWVQVAPFPFLKVINSLEIYTNYPHYLL